VVHRGPGGCASGTTCSVTPTTALAYGAAAWWVQTWNPGGYGPWSAGLPVTVSLGTPPPAATPGTPTGTITDTTPTYTWTAVAGATYYYLWVNDTAQTGKLKQWYTAAQAGARAGPPAA
jgi:hypothetical protein